MDGIQPTMSVNGGNDAWGSGIWLFAILALMWGGWGGNRMGGDVAGRCATVEDLNESANFTRLESQVARGNDATTQGFQQIFNAFSRQGYENLQQVSELKGEIAAGIQSIKDMLSAEKISQQQQRINKLEMEQMFNGVVKYPANAVYATPNPFFPGSGCCGCGNI